MVCISSIGARGLKILSTFSLLGFVWSAPALAMAKDCVILIHGLSRTPFSMNKMAEKLSADGYQVVNQGYPSRSADISDLSEEALGDALPQCKNDRINIVTHSMGGILVRDYYARHKNAERPNRVVMLAPPNQGSEIIDDPNFDMLGSWWMGPAAEQLSAKDGSFVKSLPPVDFDTGVIAGDHSINPYFSDIIPGKDDGAVAVQSTRVDGQSHWILMHTNHSFMMENDDVIAQVEHYLKNGNFLH